MTGGDRVAKPLQKHYAHGCAGVRREMSVEYSGILAIRPVPWQDRQLRLIDRGEEAPIASRDDGSLQTLQVPVHPCFFRYVATFV